MVRVTDLRAGDSPRLDGLDPRHTQALAELGAELSPILVSRSTMRVVDGMHRLAAARAKGQEKISVQFCDGTDDEAFLLAVKVNAACGLPLTLADRRAAARRILRSFPQLSNRSIAAITSLAPNTVGRIREDTTVQPAQSNARIGKDGRIRPLDSTRGRQSASAHITANPTASLREIAARAGISVGTARDVRERIRNGQDPLNTRRPRQTFANGAAPSPGAKQRARVATPPVDARAIVDGLQSDPSLRYQESGRSLLRWLCSRAVTPGEWQALVVDVPPHSAILISRLAHACADAWAQLAKELEQGAERRRAL